MDESFGRDIETGGIAEGRAPDPASVNEVVVNRAAAVHYGLGVGDTFTMVVADARAGRRGVPHVSLPGTSTFGGPHVKAHVVGVADTVVDRPVAR